MALFHRTDTVSGLMLPDTAGFCPIGLCSIFAHSTMMMAAPAAVKTPVVLDKIIRAERYSGYFYDNVTYQSGKTPLATYTLTPNNSPTAISLSTIEGGGDNYTAIWTGSFSPTVSGTYTFSTTSDDGSFLWVGPSALAPTTTNALVKNGGTHGSNKVSASIDLVVGTAYDFRAIMGDEGGGQQMDVSVTPPGGSETYALWTWLGCIPGTYQLQAKITSQATTTQSVTVANGVVLVTAKLWGGGGGYSSQGVGNKYGGSGGYQYLEIPVVAGDVLTYAVGGGGGKPTGGSSGSNQGNGGAGGPAGGGSGGGGRTEIYKNGVLVGVAGGGGGAGSTDGFGNESGPGGGLSGGTTPDTNGVHGATGGTQSAPGAGGYSYNQPSNVGSPGSGGNGGAGQALGNTGGGGGGYYGGGGGGQDPQGQSGSGAGGSSYAHPTLTKNATTTAGGTPTPANTQDADYIANAGRGGIGGGPNGQPGLAVLSFS